MRALVELLQRLAVADAQETGFLQLPKPGDEERWRRRSENVKTGMFIDTHLLAYLKFFDASTVDDDPANFYMEREWRVPGSVPFTLGDVYRVYLPESYARPFRTEFPDYNAQLTYVDP